MDNIGDKISFLEDKINLINQNVQFNINLTWTLFGVIIATAGAALVFLAKILVDKVVKKELSIMEERILKSIKNNPEYINISGETIFQIQSGNILENNVLSNIISIGFIIRIDEKYNLEFPPRVDIYYENRDDHICKLDDFEIFTSKNENFNIIKLNKNDIFIQTSIKENMKDAFKTPVYYNLQFKNKNY